MIYDFKIISKSTKSSKHLELKDVDSLNVGFIDINNIPNSSFPREIKTLSEQDWKKVNKGDIITKTHIMKVTITMVKRH